MRDVGVNGHSETECSGLRSANGPMAGSLFSGMGGFATGLKAAGFSFAWATDNDSMAATTFRHRFPEVRFIEKDVRNLHVVGDALASVDILAAGFPCQSFSQAGSRLGFDDPRGKLFFEITRIVSEFEPRDRPRLILLENVPNLLRGASQLWFDEVRRALRRTGYWFREDACWTVNVKDVTPIPQDRERLFMVAACREHYSYNPFSPPITSSKNNRHVRLSLDDIIDRHEQADPEAYLSADNRYFKMINKQMERGESDSNIYQLRRSYVREKKQGLCPTLTANMGVGGHNVPFIRDGWGIRRLTVREVAQLQGFDVTEDLFPDIPIQQQYRLLGNAVCVALAHTIADRCAEILEGEKA